MAERVLSVCWKEHTNELTTVYKNLFENKFLVDCTVSVEGQSLKAHQLVLSACSPYFHMLFQEETGKHPFVIVLNASFETLKAVIDFLYQGETQIPEGDLKEFLTLAKALQIKGLNAFSGDYMNRNLSRNTTQNAPHGSSEDNQETCAVQYVSGSKEDSYENSFRRFPNYSDTAHTSSSVSCNSHNASNEEGLLASVITPRSFVGCDKVSEVKEMAVKQEPLFSEFSEIRDKRLDDNNKTISANLISEINGATAFINGEWDLNHFPSCGVSSHENGESSMRTHPKQQLMQLSNEVTSGKDVQHHPLLPVIVVPKPEYMDDANSIKSFDDDNVPGNYTYEISQGTASPCGEQNLGQCSGADGLPLEEELATQRRSLPGQQSTSSPPHTELQLHEGRHAHPSEHTVPSDEGGRALAHSPSTSTQEPRRAGKGPFRCDVCQKSCPSPSKLARHKRTHTGECPYPCDVCGKRFSHSNSLVSHMRLHTGERPFCCDVCGKGFRESGSLKSHMRCHTGERPFCCDVCGKRFFGSGNLKTHMRCHTGERPFCCDVCGKRFAESGNLKTHMRCHTGERPFCCEVCGKGFAQSTHLVTHMRSHSGERPYRCEVCGKGFAQSTNLVKHMRCHTGERPYRCNVCGNGFTQSVTLVKHMRFHTGERPYRCDVCGNGFTQSTNLVKHMRCHMGERPYRCDVCGKRCSDSHHLVAHMRSHTGDRPFCCDVCGKRFAVSGNLKIHMRCHTGERPFCCDVCGKRFAKSGNLKTHMRRHTGERPFSCDVCGKRFTVSGNLKTHMRCHT